MSANQVVIGKHSTEVTSIIGNFFNNVETRVNTVKLIGLDVEYTTQDRNLVYIQLFAENGGVLVRMFEISPANRYLILKKILGSGYMFTGHNIRADFKLLNSVYKDLLYSHGSSDDILDKTILFFDTEVHAHKEYHQTSLRGYGEKLGVDKLDGTFMCTYYDANPKTEKYAWFDGLLSFLAGCYCLGINESIKKAKDIFGTFTFKKHVKGNTLMNPTLIPTKKGFRVEQPTWEIKHICDNYDENPKGSAWRLSKIFHNELIESSINGKQVLSVRINIRGNVHTKVYESENLDKKAATVENFRSFSRDLDCSEEARRHGQFGLRISDLDRMDDSEEEEDLEIRHQKTKVKLLAQKEELEKLYAQNNRAKFFPMEQTPSQPREITTPLQVQNFQLPANASQDNKTKLQIFLQKKHKLELKQLISYEMTVRDSGFKSKCTALQEGESGISNFHPNKAAAEQEAAGFLLKSLLQPENVSSSPSVEYQSDARVVEENDTSLKTPKMDEQADQQHLGRSLYERIVDYLSTNQSTGKNLSRVLDVDATAVNRILYENKESFKFIKVGETPVWSLVCELVNS
jgi:hypothetical protein